MCDPPGASHNYGEDTLVVPRARIARARVREGHLEVTSSGARVSLWMVPDLLEAAARWLSAAMTAARRLNTTIGTITDPACMAMARG